MNKKLGTSLSLILFLGLVPFASLTAHADNPNRGHSSYGRADYDNPSYRGQGHHDYDDDDDWSDRHHRKYSPRYYAPSYRERVVYYSPGYRPSYQVIYYRPWQDEPVIAAYQIGDILPYRARCKEPPREVVAVLPPVDRGTRYVQVDNNVYLISEASKRILDAVVLMSGVR